ncbi:Pectin lyase B [Lasiodiplodia hormozganensis]|uniref:pectin lyase n=1 Tax=Lasiodiplodia hormozganensis TaxID=869390 RepID=A0AA40C3X4_9PEZI|nr:Pectin lyase B [Lasiodiplodia hormozganensis]
MRPSVSVAFSLLAFALRACAVGVVGSPEGFASGTTGGGSATPAYPSSTTQLKEWLEDDVARVIVLNKEFNFKGTEGTTTATGCRPTSNTCPGNGGQDAINANGWCGSAPSVSVTYDNAGVSAINLGSNKSLIGIGSSGVIRGKGLRIANGAKNIIIQNIHITELNPQYIWGGDAITLDGADLVWISLIGRQMFVAGYGASNRVSITNTEFDGSTSWSATCDGHHYWTILLLGSSDLITMKGNYIHHTSGRGPKVGGNTLLHAVNNEWYAISGHAFDMGESGAMAVAEGNVFQNVVTPLLSPVTGRIFTAPSTSANTACSTYLGHNCVLNAFGSSGTFSGTTDTSFFSNFNGKTVAGASTAAYTDGTAGIGKI